MKRLYVFLIILGLFLLTGIFLITIFSESLPDFVKTVAFVFFGYFGLALFTAGWMGCFAKTGDE